jgi:PKD repeat protein
MSRGKRRQNKMKGIRKTGLQIGLTLVLVLSGFLSSLTPVAASGEVHASFGTAYTYDTEENSFTNGEVMGNKSWISGLNNSNGASSAVTGVGLTLESPLKFDGIWPAPLTMGPPIVWSFRDIPQGQGIGVNVGSPDKGVNVVVPGQSGLFTPGFDASRVADKTSFTTMGTQTLSVAITPRQAMPRLDIVVWAGNTGNVISTIISPKTDNSSGIYLAEGGQNLSINIQNPGVGTTYTYQVIIQVTPLVPQVEFMPRVGVGWWDVNLASGTATGNSLSRTVPELGTWTWSTAGDYSWQWGEDLSRSISLWGYSNAETNQPPIARMSVTPYMGPAGSAFTFDASASSDPDGTIASYNWDFGDGVTGFGKTTTHAYTSAGIYIITLTVTDTSGNSATATTKVIAVYKFNTFLPPLGPGPKEFKAGATVPVKFQLIDYNGNSVSTATGIASMNTVPVASVAIRYDATAMQYIANLKTPKGVSGSYTITLNLNDGTIYTVTVILK